MTTTNTNAIASVPNNTRDVAPRYVSIFENPAEFAARIKIAEALANTQFVPESFRGKSGDCLVALDMAARLELNPLAIFSDIYVIDNRASFSSKFLIALVNRSGRFTRIAYDEGVDGTAEVTYSGWGETRGQRKTWKEKVPNYYAVASFTEIATGEKFTSPRVDLNFAEKNGWVQKSGSKWQTMPEIMCRYRAASILIKSVCPEIVMGLEWSDDLQDAREEKPARRLDVVQSAPVALNPPAAPQPKKEQKEQKTNHEVRFEPVDDSAFVSFGEQINAANNLDELQRVAAAIADANLTDAQRGALRSAYAMRRSELTPPPRPVELPAPTAAPGETVFNEVALAAEINKATNAAALDSLRVVIAKAADNNQITSQEEVKLQRFIQDRKNALANADVELDSTGATAEQVKWSNELLAALKNATNAGDLERVNGYRATVAEWKDKGYLTDALSAGITAEINAAAESLQ